MKIEFSSGAYVASGRGYLRPIIVESTSRLGAMVGYHRVVEEQREQEYAFEQAMSHLSDVAFGNQPEDMG